MVATSLKRTPLYAEHQAAGAKLVDFAGWEMPVQYRGVIDEHRTVRTAAGLFDVSHMGQIRVAGAGAEAFVQRLTPNDVSRLAVGRAHYSALLTPEGTFIDDMLVYRMGASEFLFVVNASNAEGDFAWVASQPAGGDVERADISERYALIAVQGPKAAGIVQPLTDVDLSTIKYYGFAHGKVLGRDAIVSRTGYTGEDGFEIFTAPDEAVPLWRALLAGGASQGLAPTGLGARDTLRLEAAMALYGHEIDRTTTPWDAGLDWIVRLDKGEFVGSPALTAAKSRGLTRKLVGFEVEGRGIARQGHKIVAAGREVGYVTSGTFSPTFEKALGMAYVPVELSAPGATIAIDVRGKEVPARVVPLPFYKRPR